MKIILDIMGGDKAPFEMIKGAVLAQKEMPEVQYVLVGNESAIREKATENNWDLSVFEIVNTSMVVEMEDDPLTVIRSKSDSSMMVGLKMLAEGKGDAFVSTGNTGALFTGANIIVKKVRGLQRPAIVTELPTNPPILLLDSGANVVMENAYWEQFAVMGSAYMKKLHGIDAPRVGLLNNGTEACKGTPMHQEAYQLLAKSKEISFVGNVEASSLSNNPCDVLVADGFTGNILLKTVEFVGKTLMGRIKSAFLSGIKSKMAALLVGGEMKKIKMDYDPNERGGSPILGLQKPVIKAHGSSNAKAFKNAVRQAVLFVNSGVTEDIVETALIYHQKKKAEKELEKEQEQ